MANDNLGGGGKIITNYSYDFNGLSTGILYSRPRYVQNNKEQSCTAIRVGAGIRND